MEIKTLIKLLKNYKENKATLNIRLKELKNKRIELKNLEVDTSISGINYDTEGIHSKNTISDKTGNSVTKVDSRRIKLEEDIAKLEEEIRQLRKDVETVDDRLEILTYKEKQLLIARYIEECSYVDIGNRVYYQIYNETRSSDAIKRIIEKAMKKITKIQ